MSAPDSRRVPRDQVGTIVKAVYAEAERIDWEHLPGSARTAQYDKWVTDPDVGGVLTLYMSVENARSWLKDGPMKEFGRAKLGAGRYAKYGTQTGPTPEQLIAHVLGSEATLVEGSLGVKPMHCHATLDSSKTLVVWDIAQNFRHLVWAGLNHIAERPDEAVSVVMLESLEHPVTKADREWHARIAKRCSMTVSYYRMVSHRSPEGGDGG